MSSITCKEDPVLVRVRCCLALIDFVISQPSLGLDFEPGRVCSRLGELCERLEGEFLGRVQFACVDHDSDLTVAEREDVHRLVVTSIDNPVIVGDARRAKKGRETGMRNRRER